MAARRSAGQRAGARSKAKKRRVTFSLNAPQDQSVLVTGSFCDWQTHSRPLKKGPNGIWKAVLLLPPGRHEYRFLVDGQWQDDPECPERVSNPFGSENCVLHVLREEVQAERTKAIGETVP